MKIMDTERIVCPKCKVELDVPIYQCDETKKYGMKYCHQCGTKLILNAEDEEIIRSVREGTKAMYNYTEEQVSAYWQGVEDFAKDAISSRDEKCDIDIMFQMRFMRYARSESMDEYISKQKVLDYLNGYLHSLGGADALFDRGQRRALVNAIQDIIAVKATAVQPVKHGRWIPKSDYWWLCSNCKKNLIFSDAESDRTEKQRYCSRCGARMDLKDGDAE